MNQFRLRLVLASAVISACITVLALQLGGMLNPDTGAGSFTITSKAPAQANLSSWRISCDGPLARPGQQDATERAWLVDEYGRLVSCQQTP